MTFSNPDAKPGARIGPPRLPLVALTADHRRLAARILTLAALLLILITLRPFGTPDMTAEQMADGDPVNQIGFLLAGGVTIAALAMLADWRLLRLVIGPTPLAVLAVLFISAMITPAPDVTMRAVVLTLIAVMVTIGALLLPKSEADFRAAFTLAALIVLGLAYASVILLPNLAVHQAAELESQHAGLWRGHYTHKNLAGPIMSVLALYSIYCWRSGGRAAGIAILVLATIFVVQTGSKTTLGFLPLAIGIVLLRPIFGSTFIALAAYVVVLAAAFLLTIGTVIFPPIGDFAVANFSDPTFTGRIAIWEYGFAAVADHPWFGHGFDNFWQTPIVTGQEQNFEESWDVRGVVSGHSNYVDMPLFFGIIGSAVVFWAFLAAPMIDYVRACRRPENRRLADFFMMIVVFMSLLSLMETFFFNRSDSFWLLVVLAVFGLRFLGMAKLRAADTRAPARS